LREGLVALAKKFDFITEIRGEGLMLGVQLSVDGNPYVAEALARGVVINCTHETTLRLLPPFIVKSAQIKDFLQRMEIVFAKTKNPEIKAANGAHSESQNAHALAAAR
jgi:acetylornithine/succinyldiaminopimelate/putrescine aminotransferase